MRKYLPYLLLPTVIIAGYVLYLSLTPRDNTRFKVIQQQNIELRKKLSSLILEIDSINKKNDSALSSTVQIKTSVQLRIKYLTIDSLLLVDSVSHLTADNNAVTIDNPIDGVYYKSNPVIVNRWEIVVKSFDQISKAFLFKKQFTSNYDLKTNIYYVGSINKYFVCYDNEVRYTGIENATSVYKNLLEIENLKLEAILVKARIFSNAFDDSFN